MSFSTTIEEGDTARPISFGEEDVDGLNEETFGSSVTEDWEEHHFSSMGVKLERESEDHPIVSSPFTNRNMSRVDLDLGENSTDQKNILQFENLKELWEVSPDTPPTADSIWSPSLIPQPPSNKIGSPIHVKSGGSSGSNSSSKVAAVSVQELEKQMMEITTKDTSQTQSQSPIPNVLPPVFQNLQNSPSPPPPPLVGPFSRPPPHPFMFPHPRPPPGFPMMRPHPQQRFMPPPHPMRMPSFYGRGPLPQQRPPMSYLPPLMGPPRIVTGFPPHPPLFVRPPHRPSPPPESYRHHKQYHHFGLNPSKLNEMLYDLKPDGSGFMTGKEKEWVIKVQLIQLHSANPSIDDYYYQKYIQTKYQSSEKEEGVVKSDAKLTPLTLPPPVTDHKEKGHSVFEGTLGKVSVGSASAPRKTIDVALSIVNEVKREPISRKKQALITIEQMYTVLLEVEDIHSSLSLSTSDDDRYNKQHKKQELCNQLFQLMNLSDDLATAGDNTNFQQLMSFPKGKQLFRRTLPFLNEAKSKSAVYGFCKNLGSIIKKDLQDKILTQILPPLSAIINICNLLELQIILSLLKPLLSSKYANNQFFVSFITTVVNKGYKLVSPGQPPTNWVTLLSELHSLHQKSKSKCESLNELLTPPSI